LKDEDIIREVNEIGNSDDDDDFYELSNDKLEIMAAL
jgi:hypothetical protein